MNASDAGAGGFRIRPVGKGHAKAMAQLHGECFAKGWSALEFESFFERSGVFAAVSYAPDQKPVGFVICWIIEDMCDLLSVGVLPDFRREGVGLMLVHYALETARDLGARSLMLEVNINNAAAITLYETEGFTRDGIRKDYYSNPDGSVADAVRFVKSL